jgi:hypothetical protein
MAVVKQRNNIAPLSLWDHKAYFALFAVLSFVLLSPGQAAFAQEMDDVTRNIVETSDRLPGLITAISYLLALLFGVTGILKLKEHVESPSQTPLRTPIIRFLIGGALLALPIVYESMLAAINGGNVDSFGQEDTLGGSASELFGQISTYFPTLNFNNVLANIVDSIEDTPGMITAVAYLIGLISGVSGLLKIKEHVENPDQTPMREGVIRLLTGGALFGLPTIYVAMANMVGETGIFGEIFSLASFIGFFVSEYAGLNGIFGGDIPRVCDPISGFLGSTLGDAICNISMASLAFPAFLTVLSYITGMLLGFWGILKVRDHVLNPQQTTIWEGFSRFIAGALFLAIPAIVEVARATVAPAALTATVLAQGVVTGYAGEGCTVGGLGGIFGGGDSPSGLDGMMVCFMSDILGPVHSVLNLFAYAAGFIFIMIGASRLVKSSQDGARGPGGIGTVMTFVTGGALISANEMMRGMTGTIFGNPLTLTYAELQYTTGMDPEELVHAHSVISAILKFMIMIGLISFVRGIFIIRGVAEGDSQSSLMAGITHMVGGALAVNLGALINAVQSTLGIADIGIDFSLGI